MNKQNVCYDNVSFHGRNNLTILIGMLNCKFKEDPVKNVQVISAVDYCFYDGKFEKNLYLIWVNTTVKPRKFELLIFRNTR